MRIVLLAPPGAGKGTQAERISAHFDVPHISTGDVFRRHVAEGTELGRQVKADLDAGDLVNDDIVLSMVREAVAAAMALSGGYVLDGFPRTLEQARGGHRVAKELGATADAVVNFEVSEQELIRRLVVRGAASGRADDAEATVRHRLDVYDRQTAPLLDYYRQRGVLMTINGERSMDEVTVETLAALDALDALAG